MKNTEIFRDDYFIEPSFFPVSEKALLLNHSLTHIENVKATSGKIYSALDGDPLPQLKVMKQLPLLLERS